MKNLFRDLDTYEILKDVLTSKYTGMEYDSRKIKEGNIFIALKGFSVDGHSYIEKAIKSGAKLIITSDLPKNYVEGINYVLVKDTRKSLGKIASNFYSYPQNKLKIIGVTGTNGKTTTTYLLEEILSSENSARLGTIDYRIGKKIIPAVNTTPESLDIVKFCDMAVKEGLEYLIMEISSHSLEMGRVDMLSFDSAVFTNLTQDHLDFHKDMETYFKAKSKLFEKLKDKSKACVNLDDKWGKILYESKKNLLSYSLKEGNIKGKILKYDTHHMELEIIYKEVFYKFETELMGKFNLYNLMSAFGGAINLGLNPEEIIKKLSLAKSVPGRFETINEGQNFMVVVDYAHTDDGLLNILTALRDIVKNKLITVFGAGGDRDKRKRSKMAKVAGNNSDYVIITSDNPRTENPEEIIKDVEAGILEIAYENYEKEIDREKAIAKAINFAKEGDIVLIAGKGHEDYQIIGKEKHHFDDREIARKYLKNY